mmetsp:Transcript_27437/g.38607  ORF Transcript_27437/g.38607 Transcript_27437/m.38607 type:complete len:367 (-) Transcript_27437:1099-2199(-)
MITVIPKAKFGNFSVKQLAAFTMANMPFDTPDVVSTTSSALSSLANDPYFVGSAMVISAAFLTTYSTTRFLKHDLDSLTSSQNSKKGTSVEMSIEPLPRTSLLTLYRFGGSFLLGLLAAPDLHVLKRIRETLSVVSDFALPALFLFVANFTNAISLDRMGISLTYTSKCAIPLMTVLLSFLLGGTKALPSLPALLSLIPIVIGVGAASWDSPHFEMFGFIASLVSLTAQSALGITSKVAINKTGLGGVDAQRAMVGVGFVLIAAVSFFQTAMFQKSSRPLVSKTEPPPAWLSLFAVLSYHVEYVLSFMFVKLVSPITFGACDAMRRLCVIVAGHQMFGGHRFSTLNLAGMAFALVGALCYSIASHM